MKELFYTEKSSGMNSVYCPYGHYGMNIIVLSINRMDEICESKIHNFVPKSF